MKAIAAALLGRAKLERLLALALVLVLVDAVLGALSLAVPAA
jgi:hypothetical protein